MEAKAVNVCQSELSLKYVKDSKEDETPLRICEVEYKQGDRLFIIRILPEIMEVACRSSVVNFQKLTEGARQASKTQKGCYDLAKRLS